MKDLVKPFYILIHSNNNKINTSTFFGCSGLTGITILADVPPKLENEKILFNPNNCPIYVPPASLEAYKNAKNWSKLEKRILPIPEKPVIGRGPYRKSRNLKK